MYPFCELWWILIIVSGVYMSGKRFKVTVAHPLKIKKKEIQYFNSFSTESFLKVNFKYIYIYIYFVCWSNGFFEKNSKFFGKLKNAIFFDDFWGFFLLEQYYSNIIIFRNKIPALKNRFQKNSTKSDQNLFFQVTKNFFFLKQ